MHMNMNMNDICLFPLWTPWCTAWRTAGQHLLRNKHYNDSGRGLRGRKQRMPRARLHNMLLLGTPSCEKTCRIQTLWWLVKWWIGNSRCRHDCWFHLHSNDPAYSCPQFTSQASLPQKSISPIITHVKSIKIHWTPIIPYAFHMPHINHFV